jgi:hypothetical protein
MIANHIHRHELLEHARHAQLEAQRASQESAQRALEAQQHAEAVTVANLKADVAAAGPPSAP